MYEIYAAGAAAAFTVDCLVYPLDTIKTRYQSQDFVKTYASTSGSKAPLFRGLYQGIGSVVLATLPAAGIFFATYESMKKTISNTALLPQPFVHASASAIAEMGSCLVLAPAEVIKQNAQMLRKQDNSSNSTRRSTSLEALRQVTSSGAQRRLFSGYTALVARNLPFTAIQFPIFEHVRNTVWTSRSEGRAEGEEQGLVETAVVTGTSAGAAGAFAAFITTPSDVVKTRMMLSAGEAGDQSHVAAPQQAGGSTKPRPKPKRGSLEVTRDVYRQHGVRGLFRAGGLRAAWTAVGSGLYLGTYEMSKVWLTRGKDESEVVGGL
ncbi:mitochondrial carrier domain-containing protein [Colletotrichum godetiae]|uniref:Mitochondrial carrier domain-containing protein n=1 Tax=Colletotrichum godetiae TaxID=1209918 RepID=A0AAJ0AQE8_9PEZI|nr:mitochondrial carrier domain-containing protein [Colletotrichum godetiae]KAK1675916.1 mitochondrial carrier domain-containing protein [Colletotrichum godetiae]